MIARLWRWLLGLTDPETCRHLRPAKRLTDFGTLYYCRDCGRRL